MDLSKWIDIFPIVFSGASLLISIFSIWRTRKALYAKIGEQALCVDSTFALDKNEKFVSNPFKISTSHIIYVSLINPSATPISYFDLEVTDKKRKQHFVFPVKSWLSTCGLRDYSYTSPNMNVSCRMLIPEDTYGSLAPNEFKVFMLAICGQDINEVYVSFKMTKHRIFKSRKHSKPERYKTIQQKVVLPH